MSSFFSKFIIWVIGVVVIGQGCFPVHAEESVGGDFSLIDQDGRPFQLNQLRGQVVLLFFGYTSCPDICPSELATMTHVMNSLGDGSGQVKGVFITLDPERDDPQVLKQYTGYFGGNIVGLTGSLEEVRGVANSYRVKFSRHLRPDGSYTVDHTANLYIVGREGKLSAVVPYGFPPGHVLEVVQQLLGGDR